MNIEAILAEVCRTDLKESEDYNYTDKDISEIVTDDVISKIVSEMWTLQEGILRSAVKQWEKKDEHK